MIIKQKFIAKLTKKKMKCSQECHGSFSEDEKIIKRKYANNRNKNMPDVDREKK